MAAESICEVEAISAALDEAIAAGGGWAEVFVEDRRTATVVLDDGRVEDLVSGRDRGAGIRVTVGSTTGFAHTDDLSADSLRSAARTAAAAATIGRAGESAPARVELGDVAAHSARIDVDPTTIPKGDKVDVLRAADAAARGYDAAISQVQSVYGDVRRRIMVANTDGLAVSDDRTRTRAAVSCVADGDTGLQTGVDVLGATAGYELIAETDIEAVAAEAARRAVTKLAARPAPSGPMPVVIASGSGGVLFHEACGHGLEADLVAKGASTFAGRLGEQVASPLVTLVDDGSMAGEWGNLAVDDEGRPAQRNVLIEDGVLTDYMWDRLRARSAGRASSGNGRRETYKHLPIVRMTNTYIENGEGEAADIIADTPSGVYVAKLGGGQVNTASGDFVFGMVEAYMIEDGEITAPIRDGNLIGNGPDALRAIDAIAGDFSMGFPGTCGKDGQGVPVGTGTPTLRVPRLTIGGTAA